MHIHTDTRMHSHIHAYTFIHTQDVFKTCTDIFKRLVHSTRERERGLAQRNGTGVSIRGGGLDELRQGAKLFVLFAVNIIHPEDVA